jgi:hypothetical protein
MVYPIESVLDLCTPNQFLYVGTHFIPPAMSSNIAYLADSCLRASAPLYSPQKYICFPMLLAQIVFPNLDSPYRHKDIGLFPVSY